MKKPITLNFEEKTIERLKEIKREKGIPISWIVEKSLLKSEIYEKQN